MDDTFEKLSRIARDEFGVTLIRTDDEKPGKILLAELESELRSMEEVHVKE